MTEAVAKTDLWLGKLTELRAGNNASGKSGSGPAPHKPLLLIAILDLAECGKLPGRVLTRTPELALRFRALSTLVADRWPSRLQLKLPFYHLKTQGFWLAYTAEMEAAQSVESCAAIELNPDFFALLNDRDFRLKARLVLIARYFTEFEKSALFTFLGIAMSRTGLSAKDADGALATALAVSKRKGRSARFQVRVVDDYHHICALTGYRCFTEDGASIVDAAHIVSWAKTQNDDLSNGLALSKNAHWMFDRGLWSVGDGFQIVVAPAHKFTEAGPDLLQLRAIAGRALQFHPEARLRPAMEFLRAHRREHKFSE